MRNIIRISVWLVFGACLVSPMRLFADEKADHDALRQVKQVYEEAMNSGDLDKLKPYLADHFIFVAATGDQVEGLDQLKGFWNKLHTMIGAGGTYHVSLAPDRSDLYGDIALAHGTAKEQVRFGSGKVLIFNTKWIAVFHRENGQWKAIRAQGTINAFDNPLVSLILQKVKWIFALGGIIAGLVIGLLMRRRR